MFASLLGTLDALEFRPFEMLTDHKPLLYALRSASDRYSSRKICHSELVSQFTVDIRHVFGADNCGVDALSHMHQVHLSSTPSMDHDAMVQAQVMDPQIDQIRQDSLLNLRVLPTTTILCDVSQRHPKPMVQAAQPHSIFLELLNLVHPCVASSGKLETEHFRQFNVKLDVRQRSCACAQCQRAKVDRHTRAPLA